MPSSVSLESLESTVDRLIKSGRYASKSEVLQAGIRLVVALDASIARGLADAEAGRGKPIREVADRLIAKYRKLASDRGA